MDTHSSQDFYDSLAADYHLIYADWSASIARQGSALDALVRRELPGRGGSGADNGNGNGNGVRVGGSGFGASACTGVRAGDNGVDDSVSRVGGSGFGIRAERLDILDCSCGIGTQALGLAAHNHRVVAGDLSPVSAARAAAESRHRGLDLSTIAADMRSLPFADATFDVVLTADNSVAHLLTEPDVRRALLGMRRVLRDDGLLVLSARDYADARDARRPSTAPHVTQTPAGRVVTFQLWHWRDNGIYDFELFQLLPDGEPRHVRVHRATSRAWSLDELTALVRESGFDDVTWHTVDQTRFFQPVLTARPKRRLPDDPA